MSKDEKQKMYVANCQICTLAEKMKDCEKCPFNVGLSQKQQVTK